MWNKEGKDIMEKRKKKRPEKEKGERMSRW